MTEARYWAVVPAAGIGRRLGAALPKQYLPLAGRPVIAHTLTTLLRHPRISGLAIAIGATDSHWRQLRLESDKPVLPVAGGPERCHSVLNAVLALHEVAGPDDWALVHDAVRPCLRAADIDKLLATLADDPVGGLLATPARDTIKRAGPDGRVAATVERVGLWHALTPQLFRLRVLRTALRQALERNLIVTDDAAAVEALGLTPRLVEGRADNIKITRPEDLPLAEFYLTRRG